MRIPYFLRPRYPPRWCLVEIATWWIRNTRMWVSARGRSLASVSSQTINNKWNIQHDFSRFAVLACCMHYRVTGTLGLMLIGRTLKRAVHPIQRPFRFLLRVTNEHTPKTQTSHSTALPQWNTDELWFDRVALVPCETPMNSELTEWHLFPVKRRWSLIW